MHPELAALQADTTAVRKAWNEDRSSHIAAVKALAAAERDYRKAREIEWVTIRSEGGLSPAKAAEDRVNGRTADLRYERDIAAGAVPRCMAAMKFREAELSSLQTDKAGIRAEAAFIQRGGE